MTAWRPASILVVAFVAGLAQPFPIYGVGPWIKEGGPWVSVPIWWRDGAVGCRRSDRVAGDSPVGWCCGLLP